MSILLKKTFMSQAIPYEPDSGDEMDVDEVNTRIRMKRFRRIAEAG